MYGHYSFAIGMLFFHLSYVEKLGKELRSGDVSWWLARLKGHKHEAFYREMARQTMEAYKASRIPIVDAGSVFDQLVQVEVKRGLPIARRFGRGPCLNTQKPRRKGIRAYRLGLAG